MTRVVYPVISFVIGILVWKSLVILSGAPPYLLPGPDRVAAELWRNTSVMLGHAGVTMLEALLGFVIANALGIFAAVIFTEFRTIEKGVRPYVVALQSTPVIAIAPLLVLWFGYGLGSKVAAAVVVSFFPAVVNVSRGLRDVPTEILDLFRSLSASRSQILLKLRVPNSVPYLLSALKISATLSVIGAIVGEFVGASRGLGFLILVSSYHSRTATMLAALILAIASSLLFVGLVGISERVLARRWLTK